MKSFSIKELEILSGIKAPTIRAWEQRYAILHPQRSGGNVRKYSVNDLKKILNIALLNSKNYKISQLAKMSDDELHQNLNQLIGENERFYKAVNHLLINMYNLDIEEFEASLDEYFLAWPADIVVKNIIFPFLRYACLLYKGTRSNEEHLVVTAIRKKLCWSIERMEADKCNGKSILLFLSHERQLDLLLLYFYFILKKAGWKVIYMGVDISIKNIEEIVSQKQPGFMLTYFANKNTCAIEALSEIITSHLPACKLLIINNQYKNAENKKLPGIIELSCEDAVQLLCSWS